MNVLCFVWMCVSVHEFTVIFMNTIRILLYNTPMETEQKEQLSPKIKIWKNWILGKCERSKLSKCKTTNKTRKLNATTSSTTIQQFALIRKNYKRKTTINARTTVFQQQHSAVSTQKMYIGFMCVCVFFCFAVSYILWFNVDCEILWYWTVWNSLTTFPHPYTTVWWLTRCHSVSQCVSYTNDRSSRGKRKKRTFNVNVFFFYLFSFFEFLCTA